ncbi:phage portal protein [Flavonifractor sp. An9]|uniref:phage portal protein n=1 Tax=Flavonifractor sp. An9 TaxID=1965664 RepID=UPI000B37D914|nr:phage portal protein [Flavonifractor sp. An9]OUN13542.1 serine/threonine protein phosphatase [Flavonifractor sp. An9]
MGLFHKKSGPEGGGLAVQIREGGRHPFGVLDGYVPLQQGEIALYRSIREAVPIVDAAIWKLIRLAGGVIVQCGDKRAQEELDWFLQHVNTGRGQRGIQSFLDCYLDSMLTCGRAVGEIVPDRRRRDIAALLCGNVADIEIKEGATPMEFAIWGRGTDGTMRELPRQELLLFTPFQPETDSPYGVSLLRSMPFLTEILLKIYQAMGMNWERMGNVRFAVVYKPGDNPLDQSMVQERSRQIAREWSAAMQAGKHGSVRDFVAVGDVDIKVIGADNQVLDSEVPVRQILEQLVSRTGIPPFLLGLSWSSTERMSTQQADMMTSEITAIRRGLEPVVERICELWLTLHGYRPQVSVEWEDVNLQDLVEEARAELYRQQARTVEMDNEAREKGETV